MGRIDASGPTRRNCSVISWMDVHVGVHRHVRYQCGGWLVRGNPAHFVLECFTIVPFVRFSDIFSGLHSILLLST